MSSIYWDSVFGAFIILSGTSLILMFEQVLEIPSIFKFIIVGMYIILSVILLILKDIANEKIEIGG
jgi:glucose dehydrogenase